MSSNLNQSLRVLCKDSCLRKALHILFTTQQPAVHSSTYPRLLQTCINKKTLSEGKQIHSHINDREPKLATNTFLQNTLINMYDKCGSLVDGRRVFEHMTEPDVFSWNVVIAAYRRHGFPQEALALFHRMQETAIQPDHFTFSTILPLCGNIASVKQGLQIHGKIIRCGYQTDIIVMNTLIDMHAKCGSIQKAYQLFENMPQRNVITWTEIVSVYAQNGFFDKALQILKQMPLSGVNPNSATYASILPACAQKGDLEQGMEIHQKIIESGFLSDVVVMTALIDMYAKCGSLLKARELFDRMPQRDVASWNAMVLGYAQKGHVDKALEIIKQMELANLKTNSATFASILPGCGKMGALEQGMEIHQMLIENGLFWDVVVVTALIDMYAKCENIQKAQNLFKKLPQRNVVSWTAIVAGYAQNGLFDKALEYFKEMQSVGVKATSATFASIIPACANMGALEQGMEIHQKIIESGLPTEVVVSALIDMYAKCGSTQQACKLFDRMPKQDVASWNAMIVGYSQNGLINKALEIFKRMQSAGVKPNSATFASILPACSKIGALEQGAEIYQKIIESGLLSDTVVVTALIDMYAKCGSIQKAHELFDKMLQRDVASWNVMIVGYAQNGLVDKALEFFKQIQSTDIKPNSVTFASILPVCAQKGVLEHGIGIHQKLIESSFSSNSVVVTALIDMYAKCGSIQKAHQLFDKMSQRNVISWTAIMAGYAQNGVYDKALEIFKQMQSAGVKPNSVIFASILPACAKMGALQQGMEIHQNVIESGFLSDVIVVTALIDMYAKCGSIEKAHELFDKMPHRNVVSWNAMIAGYAMNGYSKDVLRLFDLMKQFGTNPNHISLLCVLFACSHAGLVDHGCRYFNRMSDSYCIAPTMDHYVCVIDLLGRAGYIEEALNFTFKMPIKPTIIVWMCLLGTCKSHKNVRIGEFLATNLFKLDPKNAAPFVLLSNIYAEVGKWGELEKVRKMMKDKGIKKMPGCSWIEVHKIVHAFCVGDTSHPQTQELYAKLE